MGLPVPARARTKAPARGAQHGLGTGTLDLGQLRALWGADGEGDPQPHTGCGSAPGGVFDQSLLELEQGCVRRG